MGQTHTTHVLRPREFGAWQEGHSCFLGFVILQMKVKHRGIISKMFAVS